MQKSKPPSSNEAKITNEPDTTANKSLYRAVWRWHFYAGLFVVPVALLLAITGGIYLFKPHLEPLLYQNIWFTQAQHKPLAITEQLQAVTQAKPTTRITGINIFADPNRTTEFSARQKGKTELIYVDPYSGEITGSLIKDQMFMRRVRNLHGELMLGNIGSAVVELAACWMVVLLASGLYLWWPRGKSWWLGVFWPRLHFGKRIFWRDIHSVVAIYSSIIILTLVMTGLPWSNVWGATFKRGLAITGQAQPPAAARGARFDSKLKSGTTMPLFRALKIASEHGMTGDRTVGLPRGKTGTYSIVQRPLDLTQHKFLFLDQYSGEVISKASWDDYPIGATAQTFGIRLHQGELFGIPNLLLMLLACIAIVVIAITGIAMWWVRRPRGKLAVPPTGASVVESKPVAILTLFFAVFFPLVGASIVLIAIIDWVANRFRSTRLAS